MTSSPGTEGHHHRATARRDGPIGGTDGSGTAMKEQDRLLPIANVGRIMKQVLPPNAKEAKETMQECVSEFISFVTGEASDKCRGEKRKTVSGDDVCWALATLGFDDYAEPIRRYLCKYRVAEGDRGPHQGRGVGDCSDDDGNQVVFSDMERNAGYSLRRY